MMRTGGAPRWLLNPIATEDDRHADRGGRKAGTDILRLNHVFALGGCLRVWDGHRQGRGEHGRPAYVFHGGRTAFEMSVGGLACLFAYVVKVRLDTGPVQYLLHYRWRHSDDVGHSDRIARKPKTRRRTSAQI